MSVQNLLLGMAGKKVRERYRAVHGADPAPTLAHQGALAPRRLMPDDPLEGVTFASPQARELAEEAGLNWSDFALTPVGSTGSSGWRADDVRRIIAERDEALEG